MERGRPRRLPGRPAAADHRGRGRLQRPPTRAWKTELATLAAETGLEITVCHFPPGTSKWNKIEHRLFSAITMNWRGRPLTSHEVIVNSIAATTTRTGLAVRAELDPGSYPTGTQISDAQMAAVPLARHRFHGDWNYTIHPRPGPPPPATSAAEPSRIAASCRTRVMLSHPALTGMSRQLDNLIAELAGLQETQREQPAPAAWHRAPPRGRSRSAPQADRRRPDPGHRALPAQALHTSSPWRTVRRGPQQDHRGHPRNPPAPGTTLLRHHTRDRPVPRTSRPDRLPRSRERRTGNTDQVSVLIICEP